MKRLRVNRLQNASMLCEKGMNSSVKRRLLCGGTPVVSVIVLVESQVTVLPCARSKQVRLLTQVS